MRLRNLWPVAVVALLVAAPAVAEDPYEKADDTWISISGTVDEVAADTFNLDYGDGEIVVEMDDGDRDADAYMLMEGDEVTVNGRIDDDFFEARTIEASSVYVEKLDTYFYASAVDEEDVSGSFITYWTPVVTSRTVIQGMVTEVDDDEFVINNGVRRMRVEVEEMPYNPLDEDGYQRIEVGDRVSVTGMIDDDLFEGRELVAESVIEIED